MALLVGRSPTSGTMQVSCRGRNPKKDHKFSCTLWWMRRGMSMRCGATCLTPGQSYDPAAGNLPVNAGRVAAPVAALARCSSPPSAAAHRRSPCSVHGRDSSRAKQSSRRRAPLNGSRYSRSRSTRKFGAVGTSPLARNTHTLRRDNLAPSLSQSAGANVARLMATS